MRDLIMKHSLSGKSNFLAAVRDSLSTTSHSSFYVSILHITARLKPLTGNQVSAVLNVSEQLWGPLPSRADTV